MSKPWSEDWAHATEAQTGSTAELHYGEGQECCSPMWDDESAKLAAAAPALVRALLAVEWQELTWDEQQALGPGEFQGPWCAECEAEVHNSFPGDQKHARDCSLDKALTAAGLPDQQSRDAARREMAKR